MAIDADLNLEIMGVTLDKNVPELSRLLKQHAQSIGKFENATSLHIACAEGLTRAVSVILSGTPQISINALDSEGNTALLLATINSQINTMKCLLKHSEINPNIQNEDKQSALELACKEGNLEAVKVLLSHTKTDVNIVAPYVGTPLMVAFAFCHEEIIEELLANKNIDVNKGSLNKATPLMIVVGTEEFSEEKRLEYVKRLVAKGADITVRSNEEHGCNTALSYATSFNLQKIATYLRSIHVGAVQANNNDYAQLRAHSDNNNVVSPPASSVAKDKCLIM